MQYNQLHQVHQHDNHSFSNPENRYHPLHILRNNNYRSEYIEERKLSATGTIATVYDHNQSDQKDLINNRQFIQCNHIVQKSFDDISCLNSMVSDNNYNDYGHKNLPEYDNDEPNHQRISDNHCMNINDNLSVMPLPDDRTELLDISEGTTSIYYSENPNSNFISDICTVNQNLFHENIFDDDMRSYNPYI